MNTLIALLGGLGIGAVINSLITNWMAQRSKKTDRQYQEMKTAYEGLLNAISDAAIAPSGATAVSYSLWQTKCTLFGSEDVVKYAQAMLDTNDDREGVRKVVYAKLLEAMKNDLAKF